MLTIEEAQQTILQRITLLETEEVPLLHGLNRVTPDNHLAPWDIPTADNSAMDGYAFSHAALEGSRLHVTGFLPAGEVRSIPVPPGEAVKIMTGAPVPPGCDTVVPIEDVDYDGDCIRLIAAIKTGNQSSGRLSSMVLGNGLICLAPESVHAAGEPVNVLLLDRSFELGDGTP